MVIYKTTNLINGKIYVGQDSHNDSNYLGSGYYLIRAVNKYGKENFQKEILCKCKTKEELNEKEIYWIKKLKSQNRAVGYNLTEGGQGGFLSKEINKKISLILINFYQKHPEIIKKRGKKISNSLKKYYENNPKIKEKISQRNKKFYKEHPEFRQRKSLEVKKYFIENLKSIQKRNEKISDSLKKYYENNPKVKEKISQRNFERYNKNPKLKEKISQSLKQTYSKNPKIKEKISQSLKQTYNKNPKIIYEKIKKISKKVYQYDKKWNLLNEYSSIKEAAQKNNLHYTTISRYCQQNKFKNDFHWSFDKK